MYVLVRVVWLYSEGKYIPFRVNKRVKAIGKTGIIEFVKQVGSDKTNGGGMIEYWLARVISGNVRVGDRFDIRHYVQITLPEMAFPKIEIIKILG